MKFNMKLTLKFKKGVVSMYEVLVQVDNVVVVAINSNAFVSGDEWIKIDEGDGDKYRLAQSNYLDKPVMDEYRRYNYRYVNDKIEEISEEEKPPIPEPVPVPTNEELAAAVAELAEIITGGMM